MNGDREVFMTTNADREDRRDAADEAAVDARRDRLWEQAQFARTDTSDYLQPGEYANRRSVFAAVPHRTATDMVAAVIDIASGTEHIAPRPPAIGSPDHTITTGARERAIVDAVKAWRTAESRGLCVDDPEWRRLMDVVRDRADEAMGTGLFGGAA